MNKTEMKECFENSESFWQGVVEYYFEKWNKGDYNSYAEMVYAAENDSEIFALAILLEKLNQQVFTGGYFYYFTNSYASESNWAQDTELLYKTVQLAKIHLKEDFAEIVSHLEKVLGATGPIDDCSYCDGEGQEVEEYEDEDGNYSEESSTCRYCGGTGSDETGAIGLTQYLAEEFDTEHFELKVKSSLAFYMDSLVKNEVR